MENYFKQLMIDGYELLASDKVVWPPDLSDSQKVELLQQAIKYFEGIEEYQKCAILREKINSVFIPLKKKTRKRRPK